MACGEGIPLWIFWMNLKAREIRLIKYSRQLLKYLLGFRREQSEVCGERYYYIYICDVLSVIF